jgi:hypothetical protein
LPGKYTYLSIDSHYIIESSINAFLSNQPIGETSRSRQKAAAVPNGNHISYNDGKVMAPKGQSRR